MFTEKSSVDIFTPSFLFSSKLPDLLRNKFRKLESLHNVPIFFIIFEIILIYNQKSKHGETCMYSFILKEKAKPCSIDLLIKATKNLVAG